MSIPSFEYENVKTLLEDKYMPLRRNRETNGKQNKNRKGNKIL